MSVKWKETTESHLKGYKALYFVLLVIIFIYRNRGMDVFELHG